MTAPTRAPLPPATGPNEPGRWTMLLALVSAFVMSQAFRTLAAIMAPPLQQSFDLSAQALGLFAATFHFSFAALQLAMGIGIDLHGLRRTVLTAFPLTMVGALIATFAPSFGWLLLGQALIGIGCSPAFVACTMFISRVFPTERFAAISGTALALGTSGMLLTGTPLAWLIEVSSWRAAFGTLCVMSALSWLAIWKLVREPARPEGRDADTLAGMIRGFGTLLAMRRTWGIVALGAVCYASFITLRGLWLGPLLTGEHGFTLIQAGNVAVAATAIALFGPPGFGRLDPGPQRRRKVVAVFSVASVLFFVSLATNPGTWYTVGGVIVFALLSGFSILLYTDARSSVPPAMAGRAISLYTMAMFLGVALMQWLTGAVASAASGWGVPTYTAVFGTVALLLGAGTVLYVLFAVREKPALPDDEHR